VFAAIHAARHHGGRGRRRLGPCAAQAEAAAELVVVGRVAVAFEDIGEGLRERGHADIGPAEALERVAILGTAIDLDAIVAVAIALHLGGQRHAQEVDVDRVGIVFALRLR